MASNDNDDSTRKAIDKVGTQRSRPEARSLDEDCSAERQPSPDTNSKPKDAMTTSRQPKLDGVLYHYYSKTLAAIIHSRLTHYEVSTKAAQSQASYLSTPPAENTNFGSTPATTPSSTSRKTNKWFDLDLTDYEIFREEIRLWRNISTLIPVGVLDGSSSLKPSSEVQYVPTMVIDVILDSSLMSSREILLLDQSDPEGSKAKRRVRIYQSERVASQGSSRKSSRDDLVKEKEIQKSTWKQPIILETWKLKLDVCNLSDPPDLPVLYRQATSNLRELLTIARQLPLQTLFERLQRAKTGTTNERDGEKLKLGIRLRTGDEKEEEDKGNGIIGLREPIGTALPSSSNDENPIMKTTEIFSFEALLTAVGILSGSVEYRLDSDFFVEDVEMFIDASKNVDLDEDFFKPSVLESSKVASRSTSGSIPGTPPSLEASKPRSFFSTTSDRRQSNIIPVLPPELSPQQRNSSSTSVFSTSASSGKPVAGLANLRRSPSITAHGSSPSTTMTTLGGGSNSASTSPVSQPALITDAAFLTTQRRISTGERRLRSLNTLSSGGERDGPPAISSGSPLQHSPLNTRPALARASISANTSLRTGSYSPSSPSPLAQQLFTNQQQQQQQSFNSSQYRASSSPSNRIPSLPLSTSPSLRSIFQAHSTPPSQSHLSISSLSRTPPRSLIESSSIGLQRSAPDTLDDNESSDQSFNQAEGRQQPSVAPQMIKRYSSNLSYRQGRQSASNTQFSGPGEASVESESERNASAPYSKSWQARIEQRQHFAARSLGRGEESSSGGGGGAFTTSNSPRPQRRKSNGVSTSQEEDLDDFVRMIDLNHPSNRSVQAAAPISSDNSQAEEAAASHPTPSSSSFSQFSPSVALHRQRTTPLNPISYSTIHSGVGFNRQVGWNRNQVDEMLNKMQSSIREFGTSSTSKESGTSSSIGGGSGSGVGGGDSDSQSPASQNSQNQNSAQSTGIGIPTAAYSPSFARSPLSKIGFSAATTNTFASGGLSSRISSSATTTDSAPPTKSLGSTVTTSDQQRQRGQYGSQVMRERLQEQPSSQSSGMNIGTGAVSREGVEEEILDSIDRPNRHRHHHSFDHTRRSTSGGSIDSLSQQPHSYDPLEDEAVGRLELVHDDIDAPLEVGNGNSSGNGRGGGNEINRQHHNDRFSSEAARRRADFELARNFGQVVNSGSSRGGNPRASLSPWRNRVHNRGGGGGGGNNNSTPASPSMVSASGATSPSGTGTGTSTGNGGD